MVIGTALALAKFVPDIIGLFSAKRGKQAQEAMTAVESVAESITGKTGEEAVKAIEANPELAYKFKVAVMADSHVSAQLDLEDKKSARDSYKVNHEQADKIASGIMKWNLPSLVGLAAIQVLVVFIAEKYKLSVAVVAIVSNVLGLVISSLIAERQAVVGFFFGSSLGSKMNNGS